MKRSQLFFGISVALIGVLSFGAAQVMAPSGVIAFHDVCNGREYVMRGDGTGRVQLPLPAPVEGAPSWFGKMVYDISTSGPVTVMLAGLQAVQVNELGGVLVPDEPVNLRLPEDPNLPPGINDGSIALSPRGDRIALYNGAIVIADIVRDLSGKIVALTNPTVAANPYNLGSPADTNSKCCSSFGYVDFSPDGTRLVVTSYGDLWLLELAADGHTLLSSRPLTRTVGTQEWDAAFSPDGRTIAYTGADNKYIQSMDDFALPGNTENIYQLDLTTLKTTLLTTKKNKGGSGDGRNGAAWSPDGREILFYAPGPPGGRNSACGLGNPDLFKIKADGTAPATNLTNTVGTSKEIWCSWGW